MKDRVPSNPTNSPTFEQAPAASSAGARFVPDRLAELADVTRLRLLLVLAREELAVGEVARALALPQSTVSRQLKVLADGGWVRRRAFGTSTFYCLDEGELDDCGRTLWSAVRERAAELPEVSHDLQRLAGVLDERRLDTLEFFSRAGAQWDSVRDELFGRSFTAEALVGLCDPSWVVADVGCGTGNLAELVAPWVARVIAIDQSEQMLDGARVRLSACPNVELRVGRSEGLPLDDASVDVLALSLVLHHVEDPSRSIVEATRALRAGGRLLVIDMREHDRDWMRRQMGHKHLGFSRQSMELWCASCGLERVRWRPLPTSASASGPTLFALSAVKPKPHGRGGD